MRIVNLEEFRKLPSGTVYCKYEPMCFKELEVKGDTWEVDFLCASLIGEVQCNSSNELFDILDKCESDGSEFSLDVNAYGRDGLYEDKQLFAVYSKTDTEQLIGKLKECIDIAY